jgi:hypothetical protein
MLIRKCKTGHSGSDDRAIIVHAGRVLGVTLYAVSLDHHVRHFEVD